MRSQIKLVTEGVLRGMIRVGLMEQILKESKGDIKNLDEFINGLKNFYVQNYDFEKKTGDETVIKMINNLKEEIERKYPEPKSKQIDHDTDENEDEGTRGRLLSVLKAIAVNLEYFKGKGRDALKNIKNDQIKLFILKHVYHRNGKLLKKEMGELFKLPQNLLNAQKPESNISENTANNDKNNVQALFDYFTDAAKISMKQNQADFKNLISNEAKALKDVLNQNNKQQDIFNKCVNKIKELAQQRHSIYLDIINDNLDKVIQKINNKNSVDEKYNVISGIIDRVINYRSRRENIKFIYGEDTNSKVSNEELEITDQPDTSSQNSKNSNNNWFTKEFMSDLDLSPKSDLLPKSTIRSIKQLEIKPNKKSDEENNYNSLDLNKFEPLNKLSSSLDELNKDKKFGEVERRIYNIATGLRGYPVNKEMAFARVQDKDNLKDYAQVYNNLMHKKYDNNEYLQKIMAGCVISFGKVIDDMNKK